MAKPRLPSSDDPPEQSPLLTNAGWIRSAPAADASVDLFIKKGGRVTVLSMHEARDNLRLRLHSASGLLSSACTWIKATLHAAQRYYGAQSAGWRGHNTGQVDALRL